MDADPPSAPEPGPPRDYRVGCTDRGTAELVGYSSRYGSPNKKMLDNNTTLLVKFVESDQNMAIKSLDPVNCTRGRVVALPKHRNLTCGACLIAVAVHDLSDQRPSRQVLPCLNSAC